MGNPSEDGSQSRSWQQHCKKLARSLSLAEMSGALGDMGYFLPLLVGLVKCVGLDLGTTLILTGLYNIGSGAYFGIPLPVQPMSAIAAVALAQPPQITLNEVLAAGIFVSSVIFLLGVTGLITLVQRCIPVSVVKGLQLGVGLGLAIEGLKMVWYADGKGGAVRPLWGIEGLALGLAAVCFILVSVYVSEIMPGDASTAEAAAQHARQRDSLDGPELQNAPARRPPAAPAALVLVTLGLALTALTRPGLLRNLSLGPSRPRIHIPTVSEFRRGIIVAGLPQLPLTLLNSVIAVSQLARELFPGKAACPGRGGPSAAAAGAQWGMCSGHRLGAGKPRPVAISVGLMNLIGPWFGAMPTCHGAGGLAAQTLFGARSGAAPIFLGCIKIFLGLALGSTLFALLQCFPSPLLGSMLLFSGVELSASLRGLTTPRELALLLLTSTAIIGLGSTWKGFLAGLFAAWLLALADALASLWASRRRSTAVQRDAAAAPPVTETDAEAVPGRGGWWRRRGDASEGPAGLPAASGAEQEGSEALRTPLLRLT